MKIEEGAWRMGGLVLPKKSDPQKLLRIVPKLIFGTYLIPIIGKLD